MTSPTTTIWRPAWLIGGAALAWMAGLVGVSVWISGLNVSARPEVLDGAVFAVNWAELGWRFDAIVFGAGVIVGSLILSRDRRHPFGWVLLGATGIVSTLTMSTLSAVLLSIAGELPRAWAPWFASLIPLLIVTTIAGFMSAMALFPTGRPHTAGWARWYTGFWLTWGGVAVLATLAPGSSWALTAEPAWAFDNPLGVEWLAWFDPIWVDIFAVVFAAFVISSVVSRYRAAEADVRFQLKWVMLTAVIVVVVSALPVEGVTFGYYQTAAGSLLALSLGVAVTKYRLYEIDLIINRALVFALLVGFITLTYASVVVGLGSLVGGSSVGWSIAATALVAVVFEPVRDRVQRWVNRLVYGRRATPYEVLSDLTGRLAATEREEGLLDRMAVRLAEGTGADRAIVWVSNGGGLRAAACQPEQDRPAGQLAGVEQLSGIVVPIAHNGETLGALSVETRRGDALTPTEMRLVEDLAGSAGLVMRRLRLDRALEQKASELEQSRRRLVDAQDVERRRLERELSEGAQQQVAALKVRLERAEKQARAEGADTAATLIAQMAAETQDAIEQIRALASGIFPPLLEAEGLAEAVTALADVAPVEVRVESDMSQRYPLPTEGAVYFCISEALTNAVKHGQAPIRIELSDATSELTFSVSDSGPGFDPTKAKRGSGLNNMADRLDALDGGITIDTSPGNRTALTGRLPLDAVEAMS